MSDSATFELETTVKKESMINQISILWQGFGYYVDIYRYPDRNNRIFCTLDYLYGYPEEETMIRKVVSYLLDIAFEHKLYYYRCADFAPLSDDAFPILEITVDDLFQEAFRPSLAASVTQKFLIRATHC